MTAAVVLPLWALLLIVAATPLAGWLGARQGAAKAISMCSSHWECPMRKVESHEQTTDDLTRQYEALRKAHPELVQARAAMQAALKESGDHPAQPERRPQQDRDLDGQR